MGYLHAQKIFCLIKTCALISNSLFLSIELVTFFAGSQHSMPVERGFNQPIIELISMEKLFRL